MENLFFRKFYSGWKHNVLPIRTSQTSRAYSAKQTTEKSLYKLHSVLKCTVFEMQGAKISFRSVFSIWLLLYNSIVSVMKQTSVLLIASRGGDYESDKHICEEKYVTLNWAEKISFALFSWNVSFLSKIEFCDNWTCRNLISISNLFLNILRTMCFYIEVEYLV